LGEDAADFGHHYVDEISSPAASLLITLNQYLTVTWLTERKRPIFFTDEDPD
jgi:hypothetical protein